MKTRINKLLFFIFALPLSIILAQCSKVTDWLDEKSNLNDVRPSTLSDFQAILDEHYSMNTSFPTFGLSGTDNYYLEQTNYNAAFPLLQNLYIWKEDIYEGAVTWDWFFAYRIVENCNIVLSGLDRLKDNTNETKADNIKGSALFFRSLAYYNLAQSFCLPYSDQNKNQPGIILKTSAEVSEPLFRSTIDETYNQIISDLKMALTLLPVTSGYQTRPTKAACLALLAKTYLVMEDYQNAYTNASECLKQYDELMDFNNNSFVNLKSVYRFMPYPNNPEIIFYATGINNRSIGPQTNAHGYVDKALYSSYNEGDLRKKAFYATKEEGINYFRGTYTGANSIFAGIATNEVYMIQAESAVRINKANEGLELLNKLLEKRFEKGSFLPLKVSNSDELLKTILNERRKELPFTAQIRWEDLRRLNKDSRFAITLIREINNQKYILPPNDKRYVLPIPDKEIELSGIPQNER